MAPCSHSVLEAATPWHHVVKPCFQQSARVQFREMLPKLQLTHATFPVAPEIPVKHITDPVQSSVWLRLALVLPRS